MKSIRSILAAASMSIFFFSCEKMDVKSEGEASKTLSASQKMGMAGYVYTLSNQVSGNSVLVYSRTADGMLNYENSYPTGGTGTGGGLGNQGAVVLSDDNHILLAVNAGSNSVSSFTVSGSSLQLQSTVSSGGIMPVSITIHEDLVYVLNAGGTGNISGFILEASGTLQPLASSTRPLSSPAAGAAQVSFLDDGSALAITEKATNMIITYTISSDGLPGNMHSLMSANTTPFGFAVGKNRMIYVSEAAGGAPGASTVSQYHIDGNGVINLVDGPVSAGQTAACWVVITNNGKYVYATNTGSGNVSSFHAKNGMLDVLQAVAGMTGMGSAPIDAGLSNNSKFLYVLNSGTDAISVFAVNNNGSLSMVQTLTGVPDGATGIAAR